MFSDEQNVSHRGKSMMTTEKARISEVLFWEAGMRREQKQKRKKTIMAGKSRTLRSKEFYE